MSQPLDHLGARFFGLWVRQQLPHGQVLGGRDDTGAEVTVAMLTGAAASDPRLRNAFADIVWRHSVGSGGERPVVAAADVTGVYPWAAVQVKPGAPGAERLLTELDEVTGGSAAYGSPPPPPPTPAGPFPASPGAGPHYPPTSPPHMGGDTAPVVYAPMGAAGAPGNTPGYPAAPGGYGYPPVGNPPQPSNRPQGRTKLLVGLLSAFLALILVTLGGIVVWTVTRSDPTDPLIQADPTVSPTNGPQPTESVAPDPDPGSGPDGDGRPQLRPVEPISVLGPTFPRNADTYTMAFPGWPFAFRTPGTWGCVRGTIHRWPDLEAWQCVDESGGNPDHIVVVTLWDCPDGCTQSTQQELVETWLDFPNRAERAPNTPTYYVENEYRNDSDRLTYSVDLSHFAAGPSGGELRWMVGVYGESPHDGRQIVQQVINDIITQAG